MDANITPEILKDLLHDNSMKQKDLEPILELTNPNISNGMIP